MEHDCLAHHQRDIRKRQRDRESDRQRQRRETEETTERERERERERGYRSTSDNTTATPRIFFSRFVFFLNTMQVGYGIVRIGVRMVRMRSAVRYFICLSKQYRSTNIDN
jgi:hypothetical protein